MPVVMPISQLISAPLLCAIAWVSWKCFQRFLLGSPLDNIPGPPSDSFVTGTFKRFFIANANDYHKELLEQYGTIVKLTSYFGEKALFVSDPKALHNIVVKDQHIYEETPVFLIGNRCLFGPGLLSSLGEMHRKQRKMLSPVFSIAHMREIMPIIYPIVYKIRDVFASKTKDGPQEIDVLSWMSRTALELIGQSGFGYSFDDLTENAVVHPYASSVTRLVSVGLKLVIIRNFFLPTLSKIGTRRFQRFVVDHFPWKSLQEFAKIIDVMHETAVEVYETKRRALEEGDEVVERQLAKGKDIMSILMRANGQASEGDKLSEEELIAQLTTFTFAGMDTTSSALARIFWKLAKRPETQDKICDEIRNARKRKEGSGDLTYDELMNLPYLDAVCRETLRLYPPVNSVSRITTQDIVLPLGTPIKGLDGRKITEIPIVKGTQVMVGILASNVNPEIWGPDSHEWKPERWLEPLPESVTAARIPGIYSNLLTFLGGGRACIGFKFSQLEMKAVLSLLLESFKFSLSDKKVFWKTGGLACPALVDDPAVRRLPLMVEKRPKELSTY